MHAGRIVTIEDLRATPGEEVLPKWELMREFIRQRDLIEVDPDARVSKGRNGTTAVYEPRDEFNGKFKVSIQGENVRVGPGFVNTDMPTIGGIYLDGLDAERKQQEVPGVELEGEPGEDGRSFIVVRLLLDPATGVPLSEEADWLTIEHVASLRETRREREPAEGFEALAILYWNEERTRVAKVNQVVFMDLKHSFAFGIAEGRGFHFFSAR